MAFFRMGGSVIVELDPFFQPVPVLDGIFPQLPEHVIYGWSF
ncbi:MAG TPA: hypothetical protein PKW56_06790 [Clostridiales bacterium]|nr:hypothetical protein [Clostridiales bacterium]